MRIIYIYRNPQMGFSIGKVFKTIEEEIGKTNDVTALYMPKSGYDLKSLLHNIKFVKNELKKSDYNIVHITGTEHYLIPFIKGAKVVVTIHDLGRYLTLKGIKRFFYNTIHIFPLHFANKISCISQYSVKELKSSLFVRDSKLSVISDAVGPEFILQKKEFNDKKPTVLHIGTRPHKNLIRTIHALSDISCHLRIVGKVDDETIEKLKSHKIDYSCVSNLTDCELLTEYYNCDIVNFPSLHEGFGMPIIEAQAIGRVVITSIIEPMKSVAGKNAAICDPYNIHSIREIYQKIINDKEYRESVIASGLENVRKYSVENISKQYIDLYKSLL